MSTDFTGDYERRALKGEMVLTKFLDNEEIKKVKSVSNNDIRVYFNGGYEDAERLRAIVMQARYEEPTTSEYEITCLEITPLSSYRPITHRHVLGTLMSLGLKRQVMGDIIINNQLINVFVINDVVNFIQTNLLEINQVSVRVVAKDTATIVTTSELEELMINIPSVRLDAIIAKVLRLARGKANEIIEKGLVQINHNECLNNSYQVKINDIISVRHFGRIELLEIVRTTKKDRLQVRIGLKH